MSTTLHPSLVTVSERLVVPTCAGCGAMRRLGSCESGCSEQRLDLIPAALYDELVSVRRDARAGIDAFRAVVEEFVRSQPTAGECEAAYRSLQYQARTVLHRFPDPPLDDQVLRGPTRPAATEWCADCGGVDAPQQCLEFCIWRSVEWVSETSYQRERRLVVSDWLIERRLRDILRRIASVTPLDGEWRHSWLAFQAEARELLDACEPAPSTAALEDEYPRAAGHATAPGPGLTPDHEAEAFRRARLEGMAWARGYATADEVRTLVESAEVAGGDGLASDDLHRRGFLEGAEEVLYAELGG